MERKERDALKRQRIRVVLLRSQHMSVLEIHRRIGVARSSAYRIIQKFIEDGEASFEDKRKSVQVKKVTDEYVELLEQLVTEYPQDYGWHRTTWTREALSIQLEELTGIAAHPTHVGRILNALGIRWGRPRPVPLRYTSNAAKSRRVNKIKRMLDELPATEVAVYADEVDVHLNPKIGPCWMPKGHQYEIETPGKNEKRYLCGGLNPKTGHVVWTCSERKNSAMFIEWLHVLKKAYRRYRKIHVVCDNYIIHKSQITNRALKKLKTIELHFLPPYSPEHNPIERLWGELHANVTRNHRHRTMNSLMLAVVNFMKMATPYPGSRPSLSREAVVLN